MGLSELEKKFGDGKKSIFCISKFIQKFHERNRKCLSFRVGKDNFSQIFPVIHIKLSFFRSSKTKKQS